MRPAIYVALQRAALSTLFDRGSLHQPPLLVEIWFDTDVESGVPANGYPYDGEVSGTPFTHPQYNPNAFYLYDLGVVVLDKPVKMKKYGALPEQDVLDRLVNRRGLQDVTFTAVGYGLQESFPDAASWKENNQRVRMVAHPRLIQINTGYGGFLPAAVEQPRPGDLRRFGRPQLHREHQCRRRRDLLRDQRQLRRYRRRLSRGPGG
jgi:hypothetical protein